MLFRSVVPFRMAGIRLRCLPPLPGASAFPELNLRTYVRHGGRSGVWFFSLDAAHRPAVRVARASFGLPYFDAHMHCTPQADGSIEYRSRRVHRGAVPAELRCRYAPLGAPFRAELGSLEHFLCERYCLFTAARRHDIRRGDIEHEPWPLQRARWQHERLDMTRLCGGIALDREPDSLLFARELRVWAALPVQSGGQSQGNSC